MWWEISFLCPEVEIILLYQRLAEFSYEGPNSKHFRLCRWDGLCCNSLTRPLHFKSSQVMSLQYLSHGLEFVDFYSAWRTFPQRHRVTKYRRRTASFNAMSWSHVEGGKIPSQEEELNFSWLQAVVSCWNQRMEDDSMSCVLRAADLSDPKKECLRLPGAVLTHILTVTQSPGTSSEAGRVTHSSLKT